MKPKHIVIIGAGISGLALAWHLKKKFKDLLSITIVEKNQRTGGLVNSFREDGFFFEQGPRGFRPKGNGLATLQLIQDLKIEKHLVVASPLSKQRYLYLNNKLYRLPKNLLSFLFSPLTRTCLIPCAKEFFHSSKSNFTDESISGFFQRHFNSYITDTFIDPLVSGIFAGDMNKLSLKSCFPTVEQWEKKYLSLIKGAFSQKKKKYEDPFIQSFSQAPLLSFKEGMSFLTRRLSQAFSSNILLSQAVHSLRFNQNTVSVMLDRKTLIADHVFSTIPSFALANLLPPSEKKLSSLLKDIPFSSLACVNLAFQENILKQRGFGYLIPHKAKENILGSTWDSLIFPEHNQSPHQTRLTVMMGGTKFPQYLSLSNKELLKLALQSIKKHLNIHTSPHYFSVNLSPNAIPQYHVGHEQKISAIHQYLKDSKLQLNLLGHSFQGIGINDCIFQSAKIVKDFNL